MTSFFLKELIWFREASLISRRKAFPFVWKSFFAFFQIEILFREISYPSKRTISFFRLNEVYQGITSVLI